MQAIGKWLVGVVLGWLIEYFKGLVLTGVGKVTRWWRQRKATKKLEENVEQGKPRDEEAIKDETDFLNS